MRKIRRLTAITVLFTFFISLQMAFPPVAQAAPSVSVINIEEVYDTARVLNKVVIDISGTDLKDAAVIIRITGEGPVILGGTGSGSIGTRTLNTDNLIAFEITNLGTRIPEWNNGISISGIIVNVDNTNMPSITKIQPNLAYTGDSEDITIEGSNLLSVPMAIQGPLTYTFTTSTATMIKISNLNGNPGWRHIVYERQAIASGVNTSFRKTYQNQFRVVDKYVLDDLVIFPGRGPVGTEVTFSAPNLENSSVFFLTSTDSEYMREYMGTDYRYIPNTTSNDLIKVKVPQGLVPGTYKLVLTNYIANPEIGDLRPTILKENAVGDFIVISAGDASEILDIYPVTGPNLVHNEVKITGRNFDELNIDGLTLSNTKPVKSTLSGNDNTLLTLTYDEGFYKPIGASASMNVSIKKELKVIIGDQASFQLSMDDLTHFTDSSDILEIVTKIIDNQAVINNPVQDVIIELTTYLTDTSAAKTEFIFSERVVKEKGFTYILSYELPTIDKVTPDHIQVVEETPGNQNDYKTKEEMYVGITGQSFMVSRYTHSATQTQTITYPIVNLGGSITVERTNDEVKINGSPATGAIYEVYNNGSLVTGAIGRDTGNKILIKLPANTEGINVNNINHPTNLEITNPMRNSIDYGAVPGRKIDAFTFITDSENNTPVIIKLEPNAVSINGHKGVIISGYNFSPNAKLYLEDQEITGITVAIDGRNITFDAPSRQEGKTRILVMNPTGSMDGTDFLYVSSYSIPNISKVTPSEGTIGSLVIIDGTGFVMPDPTSEMNSDWGIYRLIGSRVLLGDLDINDYVYDNGKIDFKPYISTADDLILQFDDKGIGMLADYYHSVILENASGVYYVIRYNDKGQIELTDGRSQTYILTQSGSNNWQAIDQNNKTWNRVSVTTAGITISDDTSSLILTMLTPYTTSGGKIVGNRVKVIDKGTRIVAAIPNMELPEFGVGPGSYDVTVVNPDTNRATLKNGFTFKVPSRVPIITAIIPDEGHAGGGYSIRIEGANFYSGTPSARVFINSIEAQVTVATPDTLYVTVPAYPGNLQQEWGVNRKSVPVIILNPDGGSTGLESGFTYVVSGSSPQILSIVPDSGSGAGGNQVIINGYDFRYYEPYDRSRGKNPNEDPDVKYTDLNNNGKWDDLRGFDKLADIPADPGDPNYVNTPLLVLPKIYFGEKPAAILYYDDTKIIVEAPPGNGKVEVYAVNNDYGISNKVPYTYTALAPAIVSVVPNTGSKFGNDPVEILGRDFGPSVFDLWGRDTAGQASLLPEVKMPLVRFGNISNKGVRINEPNYGSVVLGPTAIDLTGGLKVSYDGIDKLHFNLDYNGDTFSGEIPYSNTMNLFVDLNILENSQGEAFSGHELVKVYVDFAEQRLVLERGYAQASLINDTHITLVTPPYYTVGEVPLTAFNPDGSFAASTFTYKNPSTNPTITNVVRDGEDPILKEVDGVNYRILPVNHKGGAIIEVKGTEFMRNALVQIVAASGIITIRNVEYDDINPSYAGEWLRFTLPAIPESEAGNLLPLVITNEDGGVAWSNRSPSGPPIYLEITKGETTPSINDITPEIGPAAGGTWVRVSGTDFRESITGFGGEVKVIFDGTPAVEIASIDYDEAIVKTPSHTPGKVAVRLENPDGSISVPVGTYTYISNPAVAKVVKDLSNLEEINNISTLGEQEIYIKGYGFMPGSRVVFAPELAKNSDISGLYRPTTASTPWGPSQELEGYTLSAGLDSPEVTFIDSETLKVKTPANPSIIDSTGSEDGDGNENARPLSSRGLIVINSDQGLSEIYDRLSYGLPTPVAPQGRVSAEIIHDTGSNHDLAIRVTWNIVENAAGYEIYVVINGQTSFIGTTQLTSYMYENLKPQTKYKFIIKTLGEFGASAPSAESNTATTGQYVGKPDNDGSLTARTVMNISGTQASVSIGTQEQQQLLTVDLTKGSLSGAKSAVISIPGSVISRNNPPNVEVLGPDFRLKINPSVFRNNRILNNDDNGVRFTIALYGQNPSLPLTNSLSQAYQLTAVYYQGAVTTSLTVLSGMLSLELDYDQQKADLRRLGNIGLNRYDSNSGQWITTGSNINTMGIYAIIGKKN